ncbi:MAG: hypothetical protein HYX76_04990 [Acidobacteria bacterium]|nr:hypothetical protein [Acidobacteriota bacterium]
MSDTARLVALTSAGLLMACAWLSLRAFRASATSPDRLVVELRLAQLAAGVLVLASGVYIGFAVVGEARLEASFDVALSMGFFVVAATAAVRDPREGLTILALAFVAHALVAILHRPGALPEGIAPRWYLLGCAVYDVALAAICYLPLLKR